MVRWITCAMFLAACMSREGTSPTCEDEATCWQTAPCDKEPAECCEGVPDDGALDSCLCSFGVEEACGADGVGGTGGAGGDAG